MRSLRNKSLLSGALLAVGAATFLFTLYAAGWRGIVATLTQISLLDILLLLIANGFVLAALTLRWWLLLAAQGCRCPFGRLFAYRLAAFGVSYFTPGPHFGGEPLQVYLPVSRDNVPVEVAVASVTLDKLLELIVNAAFLLLSLLIVLRGGASADAALTRQALVAASILLLLPLLILAAIWLGHNPLSGAVAWGFRWWRAAQVARIVDLLARSEGMVRRLCRQNLRAFLAALGVSIVSWAGIFLEYWLATRVIGLTLPVEGVLTALIAARVAILLPVPAAIGTLEASQALSIRQVGGSAASGVALSLLIRSRDTLLGLTGLWIGGIGIWKTLLKTRLGRKEEDENAQTLSDPPIS